jgi:alpha-acetolactate decarboxylase
LEPSTQSEIITFDLNFYKNYSKFYLDLKLGDVVLDKVVINVDDINTMTVGTSMPITTSDSSGLGFLFKYVRQDTSSTKDADLFITENSLKD